MTQEKEELTQVTCSESWEVSTGKEKHVLNSKQIKILKEASLHGQQRLVWFDKFAISIPHISSINLKYRDYHKVLPSGATRKISKSEYDGLQVRLLKQK